MGRFINQQTTPDTTARKGRFLTPSDPVSDAANEAPSRFFKELSNPNPDVVQNVMTGGFAPTRAATAALQPIYDESKKALVKMMPGDEQNWMLKGAEATGVDLASGLIGGGGPNKAAKVPVRGLSLGERFASLPISKLLASEEGQLSNIENKTLRARDEAVKLFPQQDGNLEDVRNTAEQTAKYISKSKNYEDIANQLEMGKGINAGERQKLYDSGFAGSNRSQHEPILKMYEETRTSPTANTPEGRRQFKLINDIHDSDVAFLDKQSPETLNDPNFYQKQKEHYQRLADQAGAYRTDPSQAIKAKTYRAMAQGYQDKTYKVAEAIKPLNQEEGGLIKATKMARELAKGEAMGLKPTIGEKAVSSISGSPQGTAVRFVGKNVLDWALKHTIGERPERLTRSIAKNMSKAEESRAIVDLLRKLKGPEEATVEYGSHKLLPAPEPKQIPFDRAGNIRRGKYLPGGQGSGPTINAESRIINLPETTETKLSDLAKKYGVRGSNKKDFAIPQGRLESSKNRLPTNLYRKLREYAKRSANK